MEEFIESYEFINNTGIELNMDEIYHGDPKFLKFMDVLRRRRQRVREREREEDFGVRRMIGRREREDENEEDDGMTRIMEWDNLNRINPPNMRIMEWDNSNRINPPNQRIQI